MKQYKDYIFGAVIATLLFLTFDGCKRNNELSFNYYKLKKELIDLSQNLQGANGSVSSMKNDLLDSKNMTDSLQQVLKKYKGVNENMRLEIANLLSKGANVQEIQTIKYVYEEKTDTIYQPIKKLSWTDYYYPSKENWIVNHKLWIQSDSVQYSSWKFSDVEFDLVVSELGNSYTSTIIGPQFLKIRNLKVDALDRKIVSQRDNFDWIIGAGYNFSKNIYTYGGARYKKNIIFAGADFDKNISINYLRGI